MQICPIRTYVMLNVVLTFSKCFYQNNLKHHKQVFTVSGHQGWDFGEMRFLPSMTHLTKCPGARHFRTCLGHGVKVQSHLDFEHHSLPSICMWVGKRKRKHMWRSFANLYQSSNLVNSDLDIYIKVVWPIAELKVTDWPLGGNKNNKSQSCILFVKSQNVFKKSCTIIFILHLFKNI